jgi:glycerol-3-phosphate acyltransferase PlsY
MKFLPLIIFAYLLGSVPFALIIAKLHNIDLAKVGSGNLGATNVARALGKKWAYLCFALDVAKGALPAILVANIIPSVTSSPASLTLWLCTGLAAILGHMFSIYIRFKGGKGVATSFGVALGIYPYFTIPALIAFLIWIIVVLLSKYISLASIIAALTFPAALITTIAINPNWQLNALYPLIIAAVIIPLAVIVKHRQNIKRLIKGTENKVLQKKNS